MPHTGRKGIRMKKQLIEPKRFETWFFSWDHIRVLLESEIAEILGKTCYLRVWPEDSWYWAAVAINTRFSLDELRRLLETVSATEDECRDALPSDGMEDTKSLSMELCRHLAERALQSDWKCEHITSEGLWLLGVSNERTQPYTRSGLLRKLNYDELLSKQEVLNYLQKNGGTDYALSYIRERYLNSYGNELCWQFPISDGIHMGAFLLVVREGYLSLPYDSAEPKEYEILVTADAALHDADSLAVFLSDWTDFSNDLTDALREIKVVLEEGLLG